MIKFETMVGVISVGTERIQISNHSFLAMKDKKHAAKVHQIVERGICYGYIKLLIDGDELFEQYHVQIVVAQWLRYIELFEQFLKKGHVQAEVPSFIEMKRIDADTLSFQIRESLFVFSYLEFSEQLLLAALQYFTLHQQMTHDDLYEDIIIYLKKWQAKLYVTK